MIARLQGPEGHLQEHRDAAPQDADARLPRTAGAEPGGARATQLFASTGVIGGPLKALYNLNDIPDVRAHLYFWRFESFVKNPVGTTQELLRWMGAEPVFHPPGQDCPDDPRDATRTTTSSSPTGSPRPSRRPGSSRRPTGPFRILSDIVAKNIWYYRQFYAADGQVRLERNGPSLPNEDTSGEGAPDKTPAD